MKQAWTQMAGQCCHHVVDLITPTLPHWRCEVCDMGSVWLRRYCQNQHLAEPWNPVGTAPSDALQSPHFLLLQLAEISVSSAVMCYELQPNNAFFLLFFPPPTTKTQAQAQVPQNGHGPVLLGPWCNFKSHSERLKKKKRVLVSAFLLSWIREIKVFRPRNSCAVVCSFKDFIIHLKTISDVKWRALFKTKTDLISGHLRWSRADGRFWGAVWCIW